MASISADKPRAAGVKMSELHQIRFPNENNKYREARNKLLLAEIELRRKIEEVAALRRALPNGGDVKEDYLFDEGATSLDDLNTINQIHLSELFAENKNCLVIYSFMYGPDMAEPCPSCTSLLDALNGSSQDIHQKVNFVVVAKSPIQRIRQWANKRGWKYLRLLSSSQNTYNSDYFAESEQGSQLPVLNVFFKSETGIYHTYNTELLFVSTDENQEPRHVDLLWPLWNLFDLTPEGRGKNWHPTLEYK